MKSNPESQIHTLSTQKQNVVSKDHILNIHTGSTQVNGLKGHRRSYSYEHIKMPKPVPDWKLSSATLRQSMKCFHFPKDSRFKDPVTQYCDSQKLEIKNQLNKRSTTFGTGKKVKIPDEFSNGVGNQTKDCPFYDISSERASSSMSLRKSTTFGTKWDSYEKVRIPHRSTVHCADQVKANPSPQFYNTLNAEQFKSKQIKMKMHGRLKMFSEQQALSKKDIPSPEKYNVNENLTKKTTNRFSFGFGKKMDITKTFEKTPGPIYNLSSFTDKFVKKNMKNTF